MFDTESTHVTVLETSAANGMSDSLIKMNPTTKSTPLVSNTYVNTYVCLTNDNDTNNDDDKVVPIPPGIFDTEPTIETVLKTLATNVTSDSLIKVKLTTKPTPTLVSNIYACLTNDNNDDDDDADVNCTVATNRVPTTENKMISKRMDKLDDNGDDNADEPPSLVAISDIPNTAFMRNLSTIAKFDLGTMITFNKGMPHLDNSDDDASVVTVPTKNSCEVKESEPMNIP